jgi:hypothetical protein
MKTTFALLTGVVTILAFATPSHAQLQAASLIGNYVVTGTESDGKTYDGPGPLVITMDKNGALELNGMAASTSASARSWATRSRSRPTPRTAS